MNHVFVNSLGPSLFKLLTLLLCVSGIYAIVQVDQYHPPMETNVDAPTKYISRHTASTSYNPTGWFKQIGEQNYLEISKGTIFHGGSLEKYVQVHDPIANMNTHFFRKHQISPNDYKFSDTHFIEFMSEHTFRMLIRGTYLEYQRVSKIEAEKAVEAEKSATKA